MADPRRAAALRRWARSDPKLHALARKTPAPNRALAATGAFEALVSSIAHQQVSLQAGRAIFERIRAAAGGVVEPDRILAAGPDALRAAGLSRPKVAYTLDLAQKADSGELDLAGLASMSDDEVIAALTSVKGIGVWTAKMFLIFHLDRPDVLPHEDLGLQISVSQTYRVSRKDAAKKMQKLAPLWSPHATYASLVLWNARRVKMGEAPR